MAKSIRAFGAIGDGVTDDTDAIQEAITFGSRTGMPILVPKGVFVCNGLRVSDGLTLTGVCGSVLKAAEGGGQHPDHDMFRLHDVSADVTFNDLSFDGNKNEQSRPKHSIIGRDGNRVPPKTRITIAGCTFKDAKYHAVNADNYKSGGSLSGCYFIGTDYVDVRLHSTFGFECTGNTFDLSTQSWCALFVDGAANLVTNNVFDRIGNVPAVRIAPEDAENRSWLLDANLVAGNRFTAGEPGKGEDRKEQIGVLLTSHAVDPHLYNKNQVLGNSFRYLRTGCQIPGRTVVSNNVFFRCERGVVQVRSQEANENLDQALVSGNLFQEGNYGVRAYGGKRASINGNQFVGQSDYGMHLYQEADFLVTANVVTDTRVSIPPGTRCVGNLGIDDSS